MTRYSSTPSSAGDGEVPGTRAFYAAIIVALAMVLMGAVWEVAPQSGASQANAASQHTQVAQNG